MIRKRAVFVSSMVLAVFCGVCQIGVAQETAPVGPGIYVDAEPDFQTAVAAAMIKKHVQAHVVMDKDKADYILKASAVNRHTESGGSKFARCLFAYCAGIEGTSAVSVQLVQKDTVVWAYQVRKANGGPSGTQSLSEAIAKHLRNDFLDKQRK